jgi:peptidyl-prolyl cis-trans isomerase B (cyclophilin B)
MIIDSPKMGGAIMRLLLFIIITIAGLILVLSFGGCSDNSSDPVTPAKNPVVVMETNLGDITLELYPLNAPITVNNFLQYIREDFYDSLIIHRVIKNFMIQGGGYDRNLQKKPTHDPIPNEADNGLSNVQGTIAMARSADPHSATSQFFINTVDNIFLDFREKSPIGWGYCVFGRIIEGMHVIHDIENVETSTQNGFNDVPVEPVVILSIHYN